MAGSKTLRHFLHLTRVEGMDPHDAAEKAGMSLAEAKLTALAEIRGELGHVEPLDPAANENLESAMGEQFTTSISVNGGPQIPIDLKAGIDHPGNADAREAMTELVRGALGHNKPPEESMSENIAADELRLLIERVERLEEEKKGIGDDIRDVYGEAKARGYDPATMRRVVRLRKMEKNARDEAQALLETYAAAVGLQGVLL